MNARFFARGRSVVCAFDDRAIPDDCELLFELALTPQLVPILEHKFWRWQIGQAYNLAMTGKSQTVEVIMQDMLALPDGMELPGPVSAFLWRIVGESVKARKARGGTAPVLPILPPTAE